MEPREKAKELVEKFEYELIEQAKQYALIAVDEILKVSISYACREYDYYLEVKNEINKL
jgi:hypothetical protein